MGGVSIQPKPKKGLVACSSIQFVPSDMCFNPAEAEEGFSRGYRKVLPPLQYTVSIQPKPKKGLVAKAAFRCWQLGKCFNPAEAEEGFSSHLSWQF